MKGELTIEFKAQGVISDANQLSKTATFTQFAPRILCPKHYEHFPNCQTF